MPLSTGDRLGPYEILAPIGAGGMGEVWKARDTRLGRTVAIKILSGAHAERFTREAQAIAALNHPHICTLHDVGPDYLVMEYLEGAPLRGPLAAGEAVRVGLEIAGALAAAHSQGIIHRDLKPANILVTRAGVKLLDFGLAKMAQPSDFRDEAPTETQAGTILGTAAYMSPEQAEGKPVDARSDIFSFGIVLYELLSGRRAFPGDTALSTVAAILHKDPDPLPGPTELARITMRCLRKSPADRFQTIAEVKSALEQVSLDAAATPPSIAVLPFANMSAEKDNEYFSDGLAEEIINALAHVPGLKVIARTSAFAFKGKNEDVRRIAEALGVAHVLEGSVRKAGARIRVTAQLIAASDGTHLWSERYDRELADIFAIQDEIAQAIAEALQVKLAPRPTDRRPYTPKLPAYEAFLRGRHHLLRLTPESWARARECFEQAIALDPQFAQPHASLGFGYFLIGSNAIQPLKPLVPLIRAEALKALDLDPSEPAPHFLLGALAATTDYAWNEAAEHFRAATARSATPDALWAYAAFYLSPLGRFQESTAAMQRAVDQDPLNALLRALLATHLSVIGMFDRAIQEMQKALEIDDKLWVPYFLQASIYLQTGRPADAVASAERAHRAAPWHAMPAGLLAAALVRIGEKDRAAALMREMGDSPLPIWGRVLYHLLCSETDAAADWFEKTIDERDPFAVVFCRAPIGKILRASPRWLPLAHRMNLPDPPGGGSGSW
ncbi:MAG TPA: protein kinase [Bryobacteraceae bacterium]|nr:protein kinase [Bryobacteraceae bacterium]